jgi:hypothetical protein
MIAEEEVERAFQAAYLRACFTVVFFVGVFAGVVLYHLFGAR